MSHPLIGLAVRVSPLPSPHGDDRSFDGVVADVHSAGCFVVLRTDDGSVGFWGAEYVCFTDPERAARVLRAHAADNEARSLGFKVAPEYTPPRWVLARDVAVGTSYLAAVHPDGQTIAECDSGVPLTRDDRDAYAAMNLLILVGEWPPLPKVTT